MNRKNYLPLLIVLLLSFQQSLAEQITLDKSKYDELSQLTEIQLVAYNEKNEIVYMHRGEHLGKALLDISQGKNLYSFMSEQEWGKEEEKIRQQIESQLPSSMPDEKRNQLISEFTKKIKQKHTTKSVSYETLLAAYPQIATEKKGKKVVVMYLPADYCVDCSNNPAVITDYLLEEKSNENFYFLQIKLK
jgi:hypothetical protein